VPHRNRPGSRGKLCPIPWPLKCRTVSTSLTSDAWLVSQSVKEIDDKPRFQNFPCPPAIRKGVADGGLAGGGGTSSHYDEVSRPPFRTAYQQRQRVRATAPQHRRWHSAGATAPRASVALTQASNLNGNLRARGMRHRVIQDGTTPAPRPIIPPPARGTLSAISSSVAAPWRPYATTAHENAAGQEAARERRGNLEASSVWTRQVKHHRPKFPQGSPKQKGLPTRSGKPLFSWCPGTESNCRHGDFQSPALPTELPGQVCEVLAGCRAAGATKPRIKASSRPAVKRLARVPRGRARARLRRRGQ
jgi:hypothetical protein